MSDTGITPSGVPDVSGSVASDRKGAAAAVSVIVPTYNEAQNLPALVQRIVAALSPVEIIVIDDASKDGTADVGRELGKTLPVRVVERKDEKGLSTAVLRGLNEARTELCVVMDADLSHPPEAIPALVKAVRDGADVAVGSRYVQGGDIDEWPLFRRFASRAGTLLARPLTAVRDPMAGFFCLKRSLLSGVTLKPRGFKILLEILARTGTRKTVEVPIHFEDRAAGASKFSSKERREFLKQVWTLYLDLNAWPWRLAKFLVTGALGLVIDNAVLYGVARGMGETTGSCFEGSIAGFVVAMTFNYSLNRAWTFRARQAPLLASYLKYALGTLGGLGIKLVAMKTLTPPMHYLVSNTLGIVAGTLFNFLSSQIWAFSKRR
ncbi:MAG TPA: glycosyltransferase family 2 protein [Planctomycetota bacterium]|nr:glycosyltransferase family 2 protein [Planctomycetota bacterium]